MNTRGPAPRPRSAMTSLPKKYRSGNGRRIRPRVVDLLAVGDRADRRRSPRDVRKLFCDLSMGPSAGEKRRRRYRLRQRALGHVGGAACRTFARHRCRRCRSTMARSIPPIRLACCTRSPTPRKRSATSRPSSSLRRGSWCISITPSTTAPQSIGHSGEFSMRGGSCSAARLIRCRSQRRPSSPV